MNRQRPRLRKREIAFAVAAGLVAAGGAGLILSEMSDDPIVKVNVVGPREKTYDVASFDGISNVGPQDVVVTMGDTFSIRSEGSPQALSLLETKVENGTLKIGPGDDFNWGRDWRRLQGATFYVTLPKLDSVALAGSGDMRIDRIKGESFSGTIAGQGALSIGSIEVDDVDFSIGGSGSVAASGTAGSTHVSIGGRGDVEAGALHSKTASIAIGGSGDVALTVDDEAKVSIFGRGDVNIAGTAHCSVTKMGVGDVHCAGDETADSPNVNVNVNVNPNLNIND